MIELSEITKKYISFVAVDNLTLTVNRGEIFGFIGPNGAGKTTTIKIISGIMQPTSGSIRINGIDVRQNPVEAKRNIGFIPDRPYLYEKLTGMEFLGFTADMYGVNGNGFREKAVRELKRFSLFDWADELIESYSHGMRQRLIFASALVHDPKVIVVDEPMVGLDPAAIIMVKDLFQQLASRGATIFMSTHTLKVAEDVCDRIGVIHRGRLIATGTTEDLQREAGVSDADLEKVFLNLTSGQQMRLPSDPAGG
ncbi:MAG: ABC transporter [Deltaproteobacteria bacterium SG8_13]|nr:MAG: ABC transporter [Deltaproteobacteria bacterium SG8_13]